MTNEERLVLYEPEGRIGYITFNRPEILNALSGPALAQLDEALDRGRDDPEVRVLVLRGSGRAFSAGADFTGPGNAAAEEVHDALTGHAGGSVGRSYGSRGVPLNIKAMAMEKITYLGVELPE